MVSSTATPTFQAAIISGLGLSVFALSTFTPTQRFGYLMLVILWMGVAAELIFFPALLAPPVDTGFNEELPYDLDGQGDDELAGESPGSDPVSALPGRGLAIPIAVGLVLAVWALHLRFLARAARPEYVETVEILG